MDDYQDQNILLEKDEEGVKRGLRRLKLGSRSTDDAGQHGHTSGETETMKDARASSTSHIDHTPTHIGYPTVTTPRNTDGLLPPESDSHNEANLRQAPSSNVAAASTSTSPIPILNKDDGYKRLISETAACDTDVNIQVSSGLSFSNCFCWVCNHRTIRDNWKVFLGSFLLTAIGIVSIFAGIAIGASVGFLSDYKSIVFIIGGTLCLIPGGYHFVFMCLAAYNVKGFKFSKLPTVHQRA